MHIQQQFPYLPMTGGLCVPALRTLRGCEVQSSELDEILQEQAETQGMRPRRIWELFPDRSVRWQLISVIIISSAMQLCGNDSVRSPWTEVIYDL